MRIAITGANGFVGRSLSRMLASSGHEVRALVRFPDATLASEPIEAIATGPIERIDDWRPYLNGIDVVIHLAARAHLNDKDMLDAEHFRAVNTTATLALAKSAAKRKVRHFIYLSSIGVHGDETVPGQSFQPNSPFNPKTPYANSKAKAELGLRAMYEADAMGITILRPPLIYGKGARGNFRALCALVKRSPALPFASIKNLHSMIAVENLNSAIAAALNKQSSAFSAYTICDGEHLSLGELVSCLAQGMHKTCLLFPMPHSLLQLGARLAGKENQMQKLTQSLQIDASDFCRDFSWKAVIKTQAALKIAAEDYMKPKVVPAQEMIRFD